MTTETQDDATGAQTDDHPRPRDLSDDELVRDVHNPDGRLWAYRDGDEHVVVSRGDEPGDRWSKRVSAERTAVIEHEQLWTIPDNWDERVRIDGPGSRAYAIYHIPETGVHVELSRPVNCHLVDKWFGVRAVGDLVAPVDRETNTWDWTAVEQSVASDIVPDDVTHDLQLVLDNRDAIEAEWLDHADDYGEMILLEGATEPVSLDGRTFEPMHSTGFYGDAEAVIGSVTGIDGERLDAVMDDLRATHAIPGYPDYSVEVGSDTDHPDGYLHTALAEAGCTTPEIVDYIEVEIHGRSQSEWGDVRGVDQSTVSGHVSSVDRKLTA